MNLKSDEELSSTQWETATNSPSAGTQNNQMGSGSASSQVREVNVDALLDQIDGLLGTDAESFVKSYVQKGGQ